MKIVLSEQMPSDEISTLSNDNESKTCWFCSAKRMVLAANRYLFQIEDSFGLWQPGASADMDANPKMPGVTELMGWDKYDVVLYMVTISLYHYMTI